MARDFCAVACSARNKACLHCRCLRCCCCESLAKKSLATKTNRTHVSWPAQVESKAVEKTFQFECGEGVQLTEKGEAGFMGGLGAGKMT